MNRLFCIVFASISITLLPAVASAQVIDCACDSEYSVGDRVTLLVDNPDGAISLPAGSVGTVLCGDDGPTYDLYISWDNWSDGHDYNSTYCNCQSGDDVLDDSHWLVQCGDVIPHELIIDCACDSEYSVGDRVTLLVDNPDGVISLPAGSVGTVLCGDNGSTYDLYISWDNWADGHDLTNYCDCQSGDDWIHASHWTR